MLSEKTPRKISFSQGEEVGVAQLMVLKDRTQPKDDVVKKLNYPSGI